MAINPMDFRSKEVVLDVVRTERSRFFDLVENPDNWNVDTRCEGWETRDIVGHMIDVTEAYLDRWALADNGKDAPAPLGWMVMAEELNKGALGKRELSRREAISRLKSALEKMM